MKVRLSLPYVSDFVMDLEEAVKVVEILGKAEHYEMKYVQGNSTYHIYPMEGYSPSFNIISDESYRLYKLAGKPEK
jgi:Pyruvate/2-oxoacid:ferredoxin oxidoreductase gamma subunit